MTTDIRNETALALYNAPATPGVTRHVYPEENGTIVLVLRGYHRGAFLLGREVTPEKALEELRKIEQELAEHKV